MILDVLPAQWTPSQAADLLGIFPADAQRQTEAYGMEAARRVPKDVP